MKLELVFLTEAAGKEMPAFLAWGSNASFNSSTAQSEGRGPWAAGFQLHFGTPVLCSLGHMI